MNTDDIAADLAAQRDAAKASIAAGITHVDAGEFTYASQLRNDLERAARLDAMVAMLTEVRGA